MTKILLIVLAQMVVFLLIPSTSRVVFKEDKPLENLDGKSWALYLALSIFFPIGALLVICTWIEFLWPKLVRERFFSTAKKV